MLTDKLHSARHKYEWSLNQLVTNLWNENLIQSADQNGRQNRVRWGIYKSQGCFEMRIEFPKEFILCIKPKKPLFLGEKRG